MATTDLPDRMRAAADTIAEANALYAYNIDYGYWNPLQLRHEADIVESEVPDA